MTNKEAISVLKTFIEINGRIELPIVINAVKKSIEALEKQIPQKVNYEFDGYYGGIPVYDLAECSCCGYKFYEGEHDWEMDVCPKCHQALDWSENA